MDLLRAAAFAIALACAAASMLSVGGAVSERLDVLTHFTAFYFAGGVLAFLLAAAIRVGVAPTLVAAAVAILVSGSIMAPEFLAAPRKSTAVGKPLKLVQFNLWARNIDPMGTARWIEGEDADIVVVEEAIGGGARVVGALGRRYPYRTLCPALVDCSTLIFSKAPPVAAGDLSGAGLSGAWAKFGDGESGFTVVAAHYTRPFPAGPQQAQSQRLADVLDRFDRSSLIVAGDFNSTPWSFALRRQDARFGLTRLTRGMFTWPAARFMRWRLWSPLPFLPIDHVYVGSAWRAAGVRRGPRLGSDHYPVVVVLERK
ncbi:MAG: endonuclease/exonuclease/phosphatase family protein [Caulobacteraceae bacterium]